MKHSKAQTININLGMYWELIIHIDIMNDIKKRNRAKAMSSSGYHWDYYLGNHSSLLRH